VPIKHVEYRILALLVGVAVVGQQDKGVREVLWMDNKEDNKVVNREGYKVVCREGYKVDSKVVHKEEIKEVEVLVQAQALEKLDQHVEERVMHQIRRVLRNVILTFH
jgi:hypothetical protein